MLPLLIIIVSLNSLNACIPTQNVDSFPCNVCSKIYSSSCQGPNVPSASNWCYKASQVPVTYNLGTVSEISETACSVQLSCPSGTASRFTISDNGGESPGNSDGSPTLAYCAESGPLAGMWFVYLSLEVHTYDIDSMKCQKV